MNPVKIKVHRLGMIKESEEFILNRFMIFSGESGLGKSYLAIICNYVFSVLLDEKRISSYFDEKGFNFAEMRPAFRNTGVALEIDINDFETCMSKDAISWLGYMIGNTSCDGDISIRLPESIPRRLQMTYEEDMSGMENQVDVFVNLSLPGLKYTVRGSKGIDSESPFSYLFRYFLIQEIFGNFKNLEQVFVLPPSRGPVLTENVEPVTGMYIEFKKNLQSLFSARPTKIEVSTDLSFLVSEVLSGKVERKEGRYFYSVGGNEMPLNAAAASVRELATVEFLIENAEISKSAVMIEEPEAHLHPLKQRLIADIISSMFCEGAFIQVTTHSDYFLRRINELVMKDVLFNKSQIEENSIYSDFCSQYHEDEKLHLDSNNISAFLLQRDSDGSVVIKQDLTDGVPFSSFKDALKDSLKIKAELEKLLLNENH